MYELKLVPFKAKTLSASRFNNPSSATRFGNPLQ
jgi:hypothetical protein